MLGNMLGTALAPVIYRQLMPEQPLPELAPYPFWAILAGVTFFALGSHYWGRLYLLGLAYFAAAVLMTWDLVWAPLEFGLLAGLTHVVLGVHLRRVGRAAE